MFDVVKSAFSKLFKKFNKGYEHYLTIYLIINVVWVFLGMFLYFYSKTFCYVNLSTSYVVIFVFNMIYILFLLFLKKFKFNKIDIFLILLAIFGFISVIFAHDSGTAFYGFRNRYEGFFQLLYYYSLLCLSTNVYEEKNKKRIINSILIFGLINSIVCMLQVLNIFKFIPIYYRGISGGTGLITNSNFFGSYMVLCLCLAVGMFFYNKSKYCWIYFVFSIFLYSGFLMSDALSAMIGFMVSILFMIMFLFVFRKMLVKIDFIKYSVLIFSFIVISIVLVISHKTLMFNDVVRFSGETSEMAKGNFDDSYGSFRMRILKKTLGIVPNHLIHGIGVDNFYYAFGDEPLFSIDNGNLFFCDKAHNEYLQKLVCEGMFSCITYIGMLFLIFVNSLKNIFDKKNYVVISLFLAFVAYCIQAFFNISVIEVAPIFWIVCGLLYSRKCKVKKVL